MRHFEINTMRNGLIIDYFCNEPRNLTEVTNRRQYLEYSKAIIIDI